MKYVFDPRQRAHDPQFRLFHGKVIQNPDRPERVDHFLSALDSLGAVPLAPSDHGRAPLAALHTPRYLHYLSTIFATIKAQVPDLAEVVPSRFCVDPRAHCPGDAEGQMGFFNADTSCPIAAQSWEAIYWSAQTALSAADLMLAGEDTAYALCRPSGHHAYAEKSGGFCFLNNTGIAAEYLRAHGHRPAILDIDVHHGNGTQALFYERSDVLTASLHVDPDQFYPFYAGAASEAGHGAGEGYNLNLPLPRGTDTAHYLEALAHALAHIRNFGPTLIVVALGLDTHEDDPFKGMRVTTEGFARIAERIRSLGVPVLNIQEGGYMQPALGTNLARYLGAIAG